MHQSPSPQEVRATIKVFRFLFLLLLVVLGLLFGGAATHLANPPHPDRMEQTQ